MRTQNRDYLNFSGTISNIFDKKWNDIEDLIDSGYNFLNHIQDEAWKPMTQIAVDQWDKWPRNWVKAVKAIHSLWKQDAQIIRHTVDCEYCNGNGFFSGSKGVEVKPGVIVHYRHTWRCAACRNWLGVLGEKIPAAFPLEIKSFGFKIDLFSKPMPNEAKTYDIEQVIRMTGQRVNPKTNRPDIMPMREPGEEG